VRCPGTLGALGLVLAPLFCRYRVAKYAGQWPEFPGEGWASRLQKRLLRSRWWSAPVTVYGQWPNQPAHIVPFFTSVMTSAQVDRARRAARLRRFDEPTLRILYVGALGAWKNVDAVIRAVANLRAEGVPVTCDLVGDGPARADLERLGAVLELGDTVQFIGGIDPEQVFDYYERSHVLVLASNSEGWPKAIAEAMSFGLICIGSNRGLVPQMLGDGRGFVVPPTDVDALTGTLLTVARSSDRLPALRARAAEWGQRYSLEDLRAALADLLTARWGVAIVGTAVAATAKPAAVCR
jgi:glycosyltransferase involved in cell wall biosynthesis